MAGDAADVRHRLPERRDAVVLPDVPLAGVVRGHGEVGVAVERLEEPAEVAHAAVDVRRRVPRVRHAEADRGTGHELHQPLRALVRVLARIEVRLGLDDGGDQRRVDVELLRRVDDHAVVLGAEDRAALRVVAPRALREDAPFLLDDLLDLGDDGRRDDLVVDDAVDARERDRHRPAPLQRQDDVVLVLEPVGVDLHRPPVGKERNARARRNRRGEQKHDEEEFLHVIGLTLV